MRWGSEMSDDLYEAWWERRPWKRVREALGDPP